MKILQLLFFALALLILGVSCSNTKWKCVKGYSAPMRLKGGEVQCMGNKIRNSTNCLWKGKCTRLKLLRARLRSPFSCSRIGYEDQNHWCTKVKNILDPKPSEEGGLPVPDESKPKSESSDAGSKTGGEGTDASGAEGNKIKQKAKWKCVKGFSAPMRLKDGEVQCMGNKMKKSNNCLWKGKCTRLKLLRARFRTPFSCSEIGYEDQNHWCTKVKNILDPKLPSEEGAVPDETKPESADPGSETGGEGTDAEGNKIKQKAKWKCVKGFSAPMRLKDGEVQCMGNKMKKSNNCLWKGRCTRLKLLRARFRTPFSCSEIGYEDQNHWCTKVKKIIDPSFTDEPKEPVDPKPTEEGGQEPADAGSGGEGTEPAGAGSETGGEGTEPAGAGSETGGEGTETAGAEGNALNDEYAHDQVRTQDAQLSSSSSIAMVAGVAVFAGLIVIAIIVGAVIIVVKNRSSGMGDYYRG